MTEAPSPPDAGDDPFIGSVIDGKYRIESVLGKGGMGTVYRARHLALGAWRAVKVMKPDLAVLPAFVERFKREAQLLEGLRHPNLVAVHDFGALPAGGWYLASELVEGETLSARLARVDPLAEDEAREIVVQIAEGLAVAHARGVVHRDIAPDNIMITIGEGALRAKLLDFGVAKELWTESSSHTGSSLAFGKLGYAAPEQLGLTPAGTPLDGRVDVFSLAAVFYRMLAGRLPWRSETLRSYLHDLLVQPESEMQTRVHEGLPPVWRPLLARALARRREPRTPTIEVFRQEVLAVGRPLARTTPATRRGAWTAVGAGTLMCAGVFWLLAREQPPTPPAAAEARPFPAPAVVSVLASPPSPGPPEARRASPTPVAVSSRRVSATDAPPAPSPTAPPVSEPGRGSLLVRAVPDADVYIDGERLGRTPVTLPLAAGRHGLLLTTADGRSWSDDVEMASGASLTRDHRFRGFGSLSIVSDPWVEVRIDDGPTLQTPVSIPRLPAGRHVIRAGRPGFKEIVEEVEVQEEEAHTLRLVPERKESSETGSGIRRDVRSSATARRADPRVSLEFAVGLDGHGLA